MPKSIREELAAQITALDNATKVQSYLDLPDTPANYTDDALKLVRVNAGEDAVEFITDNKFDKVVDDSDDISEGSVNLLMTVSERASIITNTSNISTNASDISTLQTADIQNVKITGNQTIAGLKKFSTLPQQTIYAAPTTDVEFVTKKYVDDNDALQMTKATYDPTAVTGDVFSMGNMVETATEKIFTATERTKLTETEAMEYIGGYKINSPILTITLPDYYKALKIVFTPGGNSTSTAHYLSIGTTASFASIPYEVVSADTTNTTQTNATSTALKFFASAVQNFVSSIDVTVDDTNNILTYVAQSVSQYSLSTSGGSATYNSTGVDKIEFNCSGGNTLYATIYGIKA